MNMIILQDYRDCFCCC